MFLALFYCVPPDYYYCLGTGYNFSMARAMNRREDRSADGRVARKQRTVRGQANRRTGSARLSDGVCIYIAGCVRRARVRTTEMWEGVYGQAEHIRTMERSGFFFNHYSSVTYLDHGEIMYSPFRPGLSQEEVMRTKEMTKEKKREQGKKKKTNETAYVALPADAMKSGVGRDSGVPPAPGSSAPAPCSPKNSRSSASDASLTASSSAGTRLPTSVVERKSSTACPHLPSARRSRILHRLFHLPVSFRTSAHSIFCWAFNSGHSLKRCSRVWCGYWHN